MCSPCRLFCIMQASEANCFENAVRTHTVTLVASEILYSIFLTRLDRRGGEKSLMKSFMNFWSPDFKENRSSITRCASSCYSSLVYRSKLRTARMQQRPFPSYEYPWHAANVLFAKRIRRSTKCTWSSFLMALNLCWSLVHKSWNSLCFHEAGECCWNDSVHCFPVVHRPCQAWYLLQGLRIVHVVTQWT